MSDRPGRSVLRRWGVALATGVVSLGAGACGSTPLARHTTTAGGTPTVPVPAPAAAQDSTGPPVTVTDAGGATFVVRAQPVTGTPAIDVGNQPRYAPPNQVYLVETLTVSAPAGGSPPSVSDFDDRDTGLAPDVELTLDPHAAATHGYGAVCGVEPGQPSSWCPVTLGQGLIVDGDTPAACATPGAPSACSGPTIVVSYGPVPGAFPVSALSVWFHAPPLPPQKLSG